jgi:hypothetical protein
MKSKIICKKSRLENPTTGEYSYVKEYFFESKDKYGAWKTGVLQRCDKPDDTYKFFSGLNLGNGYTAEELRMIADKLDKLNEE